MTVVLPPLPGMMMCATQRQAVVVEQCSLAHDTYRLRLACPEIAGHIVPGQFVMLRGPDRNDPLLGRPFALYDSYHDLTGSPAGIDIVYHVIGKMTRLMSTWEAGETVELWGPLGNGFPPAAGRHLLCVGGGIGYTPFLAVAREASGQRDYGAPPRTVPTVDQLTFCYGVRSRNHRADLADFTGIPRLTVQIATDDGSEGHHGFVTDLVAEQLQATQPPDAVFCCGPDLMMRAVAALCATAGVRCWLSLEQPMACGFGACFSCVTRVKTDEAPGWDYRRTCVEGPIFESTALWLD